MLIINPKLGDKVIASNTDSKLAEYKEELDQNGPQESANGNESNDEDVENGKKDSKKPPCTWKFFTDKKNDPLFKQGYRIQLTHQKVFFRKT